MDNKCRVSQDELAHDIKMSKPSIFDNFEENYKALDTDLHGDDLLADFETKRKDYK